MNRQEYIDELCQCLDDANDADKEDAVNYCEEYFDEAGIEHEQQAIDELGKPAKFAAQIKADAVIRDADLKANDKKSLHNIWMIFLGIFAMPIALPLLMVAIVLVFVFFLVIVCLLLASFLVGFSGIIAAVAFFISFVIFPFEPSSFIRLGGSFFFLGLGLLLCIAMYSLLKKSILWFQQLSVRLYEKAKGERKHEK